MGHHHSPYPGSLRVDTLGKLCVFVVLNLTQVNPLQVSLTQVSPMQASITQVSPLLQVLSPTVRALRALRNGCSAAYPAVLGRKRKCVTQRNHIVCKTPPTRVTGR